MSEERLPSWMRRLAQTISKPLKWIKAKAHTRPWLAIIYKVLISVLSFVVILAGIAMLVLPGPGWLTIFLGLAILGSEFAWARKTLQKVRQFVLFTYDRIKRWWKGRK